MSQNGKGDATRPLSVDQKTFENNWERTFSKNQLDRDLSMSEKHKFYTEYNELLRSGMFYELCPELCGMWEVDKEHWYAKMSRS